MKEILWISMYAPYDKVAHAGGQNLNYYIKNTAKCKDFHIRMITFHTKEEINKLDADKYGIECIYNSVLPSGIINKINEYEMRFSPFNFYANFCDLNTAVRIKNNLQNLKREKYTPDIVIMHWTQIVLLWKIIKKIYPNAKLVAVEEDVAFLGKKRSYENHKDSKLNWLYLWKYQRLKRAEMTALKECDKVFVTNIKDKDLLKSENEALQPEVLNSFYHSMKELEILGYANNDIIFYGAMNREENYRSAIWFIENVMPLLEDTFNFVVIGNKPNELLKRYECKNIHIVGFVDVIDPYFKKSLCFVAPLVSGAGIKIKVLEAMSSGIPVLTNEIGIEGIPANDETDYYYCKEPEDYARRIMDLAANPEIRRRIGSNGRSFINSNFNYAYSLEKFVGELRSLN